VAVRVHSLLTSLLDSEFRILTSVSSPTIFPPTQLHVKTNRVSPTDISYLWQTFSFNSAHHRIPNHRANRRARHRSQSPGINYWWSEAGARLERPRTVTSSAIQPSPSSQSADAASDRPQPPGTFFWVGNSLRRFRDMASDPDQSSVSIRVRDYGSQSNRQASTNGGVRLRPNCNPVGNSTHPIELIRGRGQRSKPTPRLVSKSNREACSLS
jgi:hypothetical protein